MTSTPVNDSPSLTHEMVRTAIRTQDPREAARLLREYATECERVGAHGLAQELLSYAALRQESADLADDQTYNGWTNYATWGVALVLDNDQGAYNEVRERAAAIVEQTRDGSDVSTPARPARYELADWLEDYTEELCGLERDDDSLRRVSPTLMAHLAEVDWQEIARNILSELEA